jgi:hypothetical protein
MFIIHFTSGAADPLSSFDATGARFLPLLEGEGNSHLSCLHLEKNGQVSSPSLTHAAALMVVHGRVTVTTEFPKIQIDLHAGMGAVLDPNEPYSITSNDAAILMIIEADQLLAHERGISNPKRIAGQSWPSDSVREARSEEITLINMRSLPLALAASPARVTSGPSGGGLNTAT